VPRPAPRPPPQHPAKPPVLRAGRFGSVGERKAFPAADRRGESGGAEGKDKGFPGGRSSRHKQQSEPILPMNDLAQRIVQRKGR
jgi:hypothetical protein